MSDQSPPPKPKPGSLRDRIAAFEKPAVATGNAPPPAPRPKPSGLSWNPRPASPTGAPDITTSSEQPKRFGGGMSASDAKESIGKGGGSLKERMAALQGRGAFGAPAPPPLAPKPAVEKPKWKPPPPVATPSVDDEEGKPAEHSGEAPIDDEASRARSPPVSISTADETSSKVSGEEDVQAEKPEGREGEVDPEEEERQRRAAIAARMARLGGARVGMGAPVFGKPAYRKPETPKEEAPKTISPKDEVTSTQPAEADSRSLKSPPTEEPEAPKTDEATKPDYFVGERKASDASSLLSPGSITSTTSSPRTPSSMPVPAVPRRAGPPRRKAKSPAPPPVEERQGEAHKGGDEPQLPASEEAAHVPAAISVQKLDVNDMEPEAGIGSASVDITQAEVEEVPAQVLKDEPLVKQLSTEASAPALEELPVDDAHPEALPTREARAMSIEEIPIPTSKVDSGEPELVEEPSEDIVPSPIKAVAEGSISIPTEEEEEDEEARKKRVAERLAKMGGVNPFAPLPQQRKTSLSSESGDVYASFTPASAKRTSTSSTSGVFPPPPVRRSSQASATSVSSAARKASVGSIHMDEPEAKPARKPSLDGRIIDVSASAHAGITEEPEEQQDLEHEDLAYNHGKSSTTSTSDTPDDGIDTEDCYPHGHEEEEGESSVEVAEVETPREAVPPPLPRLSTRPLEAASDDVSDLDTGYVPPPPTALSVDTDEEPVVPRHVRSIPSPRMPVVPQDFSDEEEDKTPPIPAPQRSIPPHRLIPQPVEDEYNAEAEQETEEDRDPVPVAVRHESLPPVIAPDSESPREPLRRLPPRPVVGDDGDESDAPLPHPTHRSIPPAPAESVLDTTSEDDSPAKPIPSSRPMRSVPPPPPVPRTAGEEEEDESFDERVEEEVILPTPPRGAFQAHQSSLEDEPLIIPPPPSRPIINPEDTIAQRRTSVQPTPLLPSVVPEQSPPNQTSTLSVSDQASNDRDREILDEEEGDPIDPSFHSPRSRTASFANLRDSANTSSAGSPTAEVHPVTLELEQEQEQEPEHAEDEEQVRRRTIAERMAKLGGIKFGAAPLPVSRPPPLPKEQEEGETGNEGDAEEGSDDKPELTEEEEERARKERIAAKLATMGGMRIGMSPFGMVPGRVPPQPPRSAPSTNSPSSSAVDSQPSPPAPARHPPPLHRATLPPVPQAIAQSQEVDSEHESQATSEDGVKVEAEESEMEEVSFEDAQSQEELPPPPVPSRGGRRISSQYAPEQRTQSPPARPPVPAGMTEGRRASIQASRKSSVDSVHAPPPRQSLTSTKLPHSQSDYVMVEESDGMEGVSEITPPPPPRPATRPPPRGVPPPQSSSDMPESISSQWELPSIPSVDFGTGADLSLSWTDDIQAPSAPPPPEKPASALPASEAGQVSRASADQVLSPDDLMSIWGRVGVQVCEVASSLHEKSKKTLIGDGTYHGYVNATLKEVPNAAPISPDSYGYLVYQQSGSLVQKRVSEIMAGDVIWMYDAKLKGHKGIQTYHQAVGSPQPLVGIVNDFETKKFKVRVFQANQHVGQQTVESASYRLEDLKSGTVKIFRVLEA